MSGKHLFHIVFYNFDVTSEMSLNPSSWNDLVLVHGIHICYILNLQRSLVPSLPCLRILCINEFTSRWLEYVSPSRWLMPEVLRKELSEVALKSSISKEMRCTNKQVGSF